MTTYERAYMDADNEVISMVNRKKDNSGQLPRVTMHFVPAERAETVLALDERIQSMKNALPWMVTGAIGVLCFILGTAV